jgi:uncharacterized protein (DUF2141 family)
MRRTWVHVSRPVAVAVLLLMALTPLLSPQLSDEATLTVRIVNVRNAKGKIRVALFRSAEGFPADSSKALRTQAAQIDPQTLSSQAVFPAIPHGLYAVAVFDDENLNKKLDKNLIGIPKEGYGASNNPKRRMAPPSFEEASFSLKADQSVEIRLIY